MSDFFNSICFTVVSRPMDGASRVTYNGTLQCDLHGSHDVCETLEVPNAETYSGAHEWLRDTLVALVEHF